MTRPRLLVLIVLATLGAVVESSQTPTATLSGIVVSDGESPQPIRRVTVALNGGTVTNVLAITDDAGRFTFRGVPPGRYTLNATRPGFVRASYGAAKPGRAGTAIAVSAGQRIADLRIRMLRGGVIACTITTASGEPSPEARVTVFTRGRTPAGEPSVSGFISINEMTDDRGQYRLFGLPPGEYFVIATPPMRAGGASEITDAEYRRAVQMIRGGGPAPAAASLSERAPILGSAPVMYPGTPNLDAAQPITLGPAEERTGVDFALRPVPLAAVEGTVTAVDGQPVPGIPVTATTTSALRLPMTVGPAPRSTSGPDGRFRIANLQPGSYIVVAQTAAAGRGTGPAGGRPLAGMADVTIDGRDVAIGITVSVGVAISGRIAFDAVDGTAPLDPARLRVTLAPDGSGTGLITTATPDASGAFTVQGVLPGNYRVSLTGTGLTGAGRTWFPKAITAGGRDLLETAIDVRTSDVDDVRVTLTDRPSELAGRMLDAAGQPAPEYFLLAFPQDSANWRPDTARIQQVRPDADGRFRFRGLRPGPYFLAAVTDLQAGEAFDPEFLKSIAPTAVRVTLTDGATTAQDVRVK